MKLLQITYGGFGGLGSVVFSLMKAGARSNINWQVGFIGNVDADTEYISRCLSGDVPYFQVRTRSGLPFIGWIKLFSYLKKFAPDCIICHSLNCMLPCKLYAILTRRRLISVEHTSNDVKSGTERVFSMLAMLLSDKVIVLTKEYQAELKFSLGWIYRDSKVSVVPNGIDVDLFSWRKSSVDRLRGPVINLGMAGRFSHSKRQDLLLDVLNYLRESRKDKSIMLHLAGDGELFEAIQKLAASMRLCEFVVFYGKIREDQMPAWLEQLDIYVHATSGETQSTSIIQAMSMELPVIASNVRGVSNMLGPNDTCGYCVGNRTQDFGNKVLEIIDAPSHALKVAKQARLRVVQGYNHHSMINNYLKIIYSGNI